jgi:hypothetical protein
MWRGALLVVAFSGAGLASGCSSATTTGSGGEAASLTASTERPAIVNAKVDAAGKVDQDEIHLSKSRAQQVHWDVAGTDSLAIVPDEAEALWPLEVKCTGGHCEGMQKPDAAPGRHPYHTEVGKKEGADPVIIIDP